MASWFWNIHRANQDYFKNELEAGRLRQGWGYEPRLDLRLLKTMTENNTPLDSEETAAWNRCSHMLLAIQPRDLIVVKNIPSSDKFTIVRVTGPYDYQIDPGTGDFGHILQVEKINTYHRHSKFVPPAFVYGLERARSPIIVTYKHEDTVNKLASNDVSELDASNPEQFNEKMERFRKLIISNLRDFLRKNELNPWVTQNLILEMLKHDGLEARLNAGANEQGADVIATIKSGYGFDTSIAVQVKMYWGIHDDITGLNQIEQAITTHKVHGGLLVTTADELGDGLRKRYEELRQKYNVQILYGDELYSKLLELITDRWYNNKIEVGERGKD